MRTLLLTLGALLNFGIVQTPVFACSSVSAACEAPDYLEDLVGKKVIVRFRWKQPTSLREGLMIRGRLVKFDERVLLLSDEGDMGKGTLPDVLAKLQEYGKVRVEEGPPRKFVIDRTEVADLFCSPPQDCWSMKKGAIVEE